jgi:hypothetical protein
MRLNKLAFLVPMIACAATAPEAVIGPRTTPPTISTVSPMGAPQGATTTFKIDGSNLMSATAAYFSQPGIKAHIVKIDRLPDPPDNRLGSAGLNQPSIWDQYRNATSSPWKSKSSRAWSWARYLCVCKRR